MSRRTRALNTYITRQLKKQERVSLYARLQAAQRNVGEREEYKKTGDVRREGKRRRVQDEREGDEVENREGEDAESGEGEGEEDGYREGDKVEEGEDWEEGKEDEILTGNVQAADEDKAAATAPVIKKHKIVIITKEDRKKKVNTFAERVEAMNKSKEIAESPATVETVPSSIRAKVAADTKKVEDEPKIKIEIIDRLAKPNHPLAKEETTDKVFKLVDRKPEIQDAREKLPIFKDEAEIMSLIYDNDVVLLCGETGSGKTTQIPQFLYEHGYGKASNIGGTEIYAHVCL